MKRIVIIGNSAAGISAAEVIREKDKDAKLSIVSSEPFFAYQRHKMLDLIAGKIKEKELSYRGKDFYLNNSIDLFLEKEVVEINFKKKKIIFKDDSFLEFDELIIAAGSKVALLKLPGIQKSGVISFTGLMDIKVMLEILPFAHTVIIVGSGEIAQKLSCIIAAKNIEVKLFTDQPVGLVGQGAMVRLPIAVAIEGVEIISDNPILEILGDSEAKAVRLSSQKVLGASLVIFTDSKQPNIDFLRDTELNLNNGIVVDKDMRTNIPSVFAAGDICEFLDGEKKYGWESSIAEGRLAAETLCKA